MYVGDAGIVEPSGKTRRMGVDVGLRYQFNRWLFANADATYTYARSVEDPEGENYIPLAPDLTVTGGLGRTRMAKNVEEKEKIRKKKDKKKALTELEKYKVRKQEK